jgi:AAA domain
VIRPSTSPLARLCRYYRDCLSHDHLLARLRQVQSDWNWQEEIDPPVPMALPVEGSPYTRGLESELRSLQALEEDRYRATALGVWLDSRTIESSPAAEQPLLEVVALNSEQRQAVRQALSNPLTVITGPPGTGKSQVVTSILVNAARQGKTVLFASKNNKAVDLVETRVNALGPIPVLLRLGARHDQSKLAEYLVALPAATTAADDHERHRELEAVHAHLQQRLDSLDAELQRMVALRNEVDRLEQQVEPIRLDLGEEFFRRLRVVDRHELTRAAGRLLVAVNQASRETQPFLTRLVWRFVCQARYGRLEEAEQSFLRILARAGLSIEAQPDSSLTVGRWSQHKIRLSARVSQVIAAAQYFGRLAALTEARSLEELGGHWQQVNQDLEHNSRLLWQTWLRLQPSRVSPAQGKLLADQRDVLEMIAAAEQRPPGRDIFRRYHQLLPRIRSILSCWAVTSLSAHGRVPFAPGFFDVLVIDEASQCDIASPSSAIACNRLKTQRTC